MEETTAENSPAKPAYTLSQLVLYFLRLGTVGFGGPVALVGYMHRDLVAERQWITDEDYNEGLALAQLAPGPLAAQLGIYLGFVHYGIPGATLAGLSFLMVLAISWAYVSFGGIPWMQAVFGIIAISAYKLTGRTLKRDYLLWGIYTTALLTMVIPETENVLLFLEAGVLGWLVRGRPKKLPATPVMGVAAPLLAAVTAPGGSTPSWSLLGQMFLFFGKAGRSSSGAAWPSHRSCKPAAFTS